MDTVTGKKLNGLVDDDESRQVEVSLVSKSSITEEIIEKIFSFLNEPKDLMNVSTASPQFSRILNPRKPVCMFGEAFPRIFADLNRQDILNCRLACKQWNRSVDSYLQNCPESRWLEPYSYLSTNVTSSSNGSRSALEEAILCNNPPHRPAYQPLLRGKGLRSTLFDNPDKLSNFLVETITHPRNPFVLRFISLSCEGVRGREMAAYWREITGSLLARFGGEVHHVIINPTSGRGPEHDAFPYYRRLRRILRQIPNLKSLYLYRHDRYMPPVAGQLAIRLQDYMDAHPLPVLPQLETFSGTLLSQEPGEPIINELMKRYSSQLKTISISLDIWAEDIPEFINLPQATTLYICVDDCLDKWKRVCRQLEAPKLKKLSLNIQKSWRISQIFRPLQQPNFQSLVYLKLVFICKLRKDRRGQKAGNQFLLENVKTLEVYESSNVPYDSILNRLPKLEYILVCYDPRMDMLKDDVDLEDGLFEIRKWMFSESMYQSNIWERMEHLKELTLAILGHTGEPEFEITSKVIYNRREYNRLTKAKNRGEIENV